MDPEDVENYDKWEEEFARKITVLKWHLELILNSIPKTELDEVSYDTQADSLKLDAETKLRNSINIKILRSKYM